MSGLFNPYAFTVTGDPVPPAAPPALRVVGGQEATPEQLAMAQQVFARFCMHARLSVVPNPTEQGRLPDGTPYAIAVVGPQTIMQIQPDQRTKGWPFIAWTAFFSSAHLPIWDRPVVDFPYDDLPPRPEHPGPEPAYPALADWYSRWETEPGETSGSVYAHVIARLYIGWGVFGSNTPPTLIITGSLKRTVLREGEYFQHEYVNYPHITGYWSVTVRNTEPNAVDVAPNGDVAHLPSWEGDPVMITPSYTDVTPLAQAASAAASAYNSSAIAAWESAHAAWQSAYQQYVTDLAAWEQLRDELVALNRPWWPVVDIRKAARPPQLAAVKAHLMTGIGDRHLTARLLSFPWNVAYRTLPPVGAGGSISHTWEVQETQRGYKTTLTNAEPNTVFPIFEPSSAATYPAHLLRRDFMPPECLFGWVANGEFSHVERYYAAQRASENFLVTPPGLGGLSVSFPPDYFSYTRVTPDSAPGLVIDSDAFVPVGSRFLVVLFEYRMVDPRTGETVWTTCPDVLQRDSIWIREGGTYIDTPRFTEAVVTERVRIAGAFEQRRTAASTWSTPTVVPISVQPNWEADFSIEVLADEPCKAPSAVVIALSMSPAAAPAEAQSGGHYLDAAHLWIGAPEAARAARAAAWVADGTAAPQEQFIVRALIATGRINP